jgi:hypothetical protein
MIALGFCIPPVGTIIFQSKKQKLRRPSEAAFLRLSFELPPLISSAAFADGLSWHRKNPGATGAQAVHQ